MRTKSSLILAIISCVLLTQFLFPQTAYLKSNLNYLAPTRPIVQSSSLKLLGPGNDPNPVVNKNSQIKVVVVDSNNQPVSSNVTYESDSPDIATVDSSGMVNGLQAGYATITARTPQGTISNFVVVTQVTSAKGKKIPGQVNTSTNGDIYISDPLNNVILKANPNNKTGASIFAGKMGIRGTNDGDRTQSALFAGPIGLSIDNRAQGGIYIADSLNNKIRKIDFANSVNTVLGSGVAATMTGDVTAFSQAVFKNPQGLAIAANGLLYIADTGNHAIYVADFVKQEVRLLAGSPGNSGKADGTGRQALFSRPVSISVNPGKTSFFASSTNEVILVADTGNNIVRSISPSGEVKTIGKIAKTGAESQENILPNAAGDDFIFDNPQSVSVDNLGNIYVLDNSGVKVITQTASQTRQMVSLAQPNSFAQASSVVVQGTDVFVLDNGATSDDDSLKAISIGAPQITFMSQDNDTLLGGTEVIVKGKNFAPESLVVLGSTVVTNAQVISATEIRFRVPAQSAPGNRTLSIQTRGGVIQQPFSFQAKPFSELKTGEITTIAGGVPFLGDSGKATSAAMHPIGVVADSKGNIYVVDSTNHRIRRIDTSGIITTVAGNGTSGFSGDGSPAISASLSTPETIAIDEAGNLFIADTGNNRIRRVDANTGIISTVAGNGKEDFGGDGMAATNASINKPGGLAVDSKGNIFISDTENNRVRKVDITTGLISTIAGDGTPRFTGDGGQAAKASLNSPKGLSLDFTGNLFIADSFNQRIRQIDLTTGTISTAVGNGMAGFNLDNVSATDASLNFPNYATTDIFGNLYIADTLNFRVRKVDAKTKAISTIVGNGVRAFQGDTGLATNASLQLPMAIAVDGNGNLFIADAETSYRIRRVEAVTGIITSIAGIGSRSSGGDGLLAVRANLSNASGVAIDKTGNIFIADPDNYRIRRIDATTNIITTVAGFGVPGYNGDNKAATSASLDDPNGVAVDNLGNFFIADSANNRIRKVDTSGIITTIAGNGEAGFSGDGMLATKASLNSPKALLIDKQGNLLIADSANNCIRKVDTSGIITTIVGNQMAAFNGDGGQATKASLNAPSGLVLDLNSNLLIADSGNNRVRRVDSKTGVITTIAGNGQFAASGDNGLAINASLSNIFGLVVDANNNLFIADTANNRIRRVDSQTSIITTVVGNGLRSYQGDGGQAINASLNSTKNMAIDTSGNLLIADTGNTSVRIVKGVAQAQSSVVITSASFAKKLLTINGSGFSTSGVKVSINNQDISNFLSASNLTEVQLKGNKRKLNLKKGSNSITVIVNGVSSNTFILNL